MYRNKIYKWYCENIETSLHTYIVLLVLYITLRLIHDINKRKKKKVEPIIELFKLNSSV